MKLKIQSQPWEKKPVAQRQEMVSGTLAVPMKILVAVWK